MNARMVCRARALVVCGEPSRRPQQRLKALARAGGEEDRRRIPHQQEQRHAEEAAKGVAVELVGRGRSGALSREVSFSQKVRIRHLIPAPLGRMEKTELAEFVAEVNRDASVSFPWPMGYL